MVEDADLIQCYIKNFILTEKGERLGLPEYGTRDYLFDTIPSVGLVAKEIETRLKQYIPQADFQVEGEQTDIGEVYLTVYWSYLGIDQDPLEVIFE